MSSINDGTLCPTIIELSGGDIDKQIRELSSFEQHAKASIKEGVSCWQMHALLPSGEGPGGVCHPSIDVHPLKSDDPSAGVAIRLGSFARQQFTIVERSLHGRLMDVWTALNEDERELLQWHFIINVTRETATVGTHPIHADTFDGTIAAFALMSNKVPTPVYPAAEFGANGLPTALDRFVSEVSGGQSTRPSDEILVSPGWEGPIRQPRNSNITILPPSVAHANPSVDIHAPTSSTMDSLGRLLASPADNRWSCRVTIEVIPAGSSSPSPRGGGGGIPLDENGALLWRRPWPRGLRERVAYLVAFHVWGDKAFAERARDALRF